MCAARKELGLSSTETTMIGDTLETDIIGGVQIGYNRVLVLSSGTKEEDLKHSAVLPGKIVKNIGCYRCIIRI